VRPYREQTAPRGNTKEIKRSPLEWSEDGGFVEQGLAERTSLPGRVNAELQADVAGNHRSFGVPPSGGWFGGYGSFGVPLQAVGLEATGRSEFAFRRLVWRPQVVRSSAFRRLVWRPQVVRSSAFRRLVWRPRVVRSSAFRRLVWRPRVVRSSAFRRLVWRPRVVRVPPSGGWFGGPGLAGWRPRVYRTSDRVNAELQADRVNADSKRTA